MDLLPGLRPTSPTIEASNATTRERSVTSAASEPGRFDARLSEVSERRAELERSESPSRAESAASRARPPTTERSDAPQAETTANKDHDKLEHAVPEKTSNTDAPQSPQPKAASSPPDTRAAKAEPQSAESAPKIAASPNLKPTQAASEPESETNTTPAEITSTPAQVGQAALAAALSAPLAKPSEAPVLGTSANSVELAVTIEPALPGDANASKPLSAKESGLGALKGDANPSVPADATLRAGLGVVEAPRDFERELAQIRETLDPRSLHTERAHAANDSAAEILRQVRVGLSTDLREANIQLSPESLGRVSIRLRFAHGVLTADVRAESSQALRALALHAPELKAALAGHAVEPRALEFSLSLMNSHTGDAPGRGHASQSNSPRASRTPFELAPLQIERAMARHLSASGVDTYA